jgi:hypothetical protein
MNMRYEHYCFPGSQPDGKKTAAGSRRASDTPVPTTCKPPRS